jgi:hypothetical protein
MPLIRYADRSILRDATGIHAMSEERSPLPEFFQLIRACDVAAINGPTHAHRQALISLIDFIREYDVTILANLNDRKESDPCGN